MASMREMDFRVLEVFFWMPSIFIIDFFAHSIGPLVGLPLASPSLVCCPYMATFSYLFAF